LVVSKKAVTEPHIHIRHAIRFDDEKLSATLEFEFEPATTYYCGPASDVEGLIE